MDFQKLEELVKTAGLNPKHSEALLHALNKVRSTGKGIKGLEELSNNTYFIPAIRPLRESPGLGVYWGPGQPTDFGKVVSFIPLKAIKYRVVRDIDTKKIERRIFNPEIRVEQTEGKQIFPITAIIAVKKDLTNFFVIEGIGTRTSKVQDFLKEVQLTPGIRAIYEVEGELRRKRERRNGKEFASFDILLNGKIEDPELLKAAKIASQIIDEYYSYRKLKAIQLQREEVVSGSAAIEAEEEATTPEGMEELKELKELKNQI